MACDYFIENTSLEDISLRNRWLDFVSYLIRSFNLIVNQEAIILRYIKFMNDTLVGHPLVSYLNEIKNRLAKSINLDAFHMSCQVNEISVLHLY